MQVMMEPWRAVEMKRTFEESMLLCFAAGSVLLHVLCRSGRDSVLLRFRGVGLSLSLLKAMLKYHGAAKA